MKTLILSNGNLLTINSIRYAFNKCIFTYTIFQSEGFWKLDESDSFTIGYYDSVEEYLIDKY